MWLIFRSNCLAVTRSSATLPRFCVIKLISFIGIDLAPLSLQLWRLPALHPGIFCYSLLETLFCAHGNSRAKLQGFEKKHARRRRELRDFCHTRPVQNQ